jgi:hypothetical protein
MNDNQQTILCDDHGTKVAWMICTHVSDGVEPASCKRTPNELVAGEILCPECKKRCDAREKIPETVRNPEPPEALRLACHDCVMKKWGDLLLS